MPTVAAIRARVRARLHDTDGRNILDTVEYDQQIMESYLALASRLPYPRLCRPAAFTIPASSITFSLPTDATSLSRWSQIQYGGDIRIQLVSDGRYLFPVSGDAMDRYLYGVTSTVGGSRPVWYTLWVEDSDTVQGRCWPRTKDAEVCNLWHTIMPDDLRDDVRDAADLDLANIQFARTGAAALVNHVAAMMLAAMDQATLQTRKLNPAVGQVWMQEVERELYREAGRKHDIESAGGRVPRWPARGAWVGGGTSWRR